MKKTLTYFLAISTGVMLFAFTGKNTRTKSGPVTTQSSPAPQKINPAAAPRAALPNVIILATGGTIAGTAASTTQAGYTSGQVTIDAMINAVPDAKKLANIKGEQISNVGSQDMTFEIMLKVANRINELAKSGSVDGIVITHGTDVMEETAYFLNLTSKADIPVVLVGSMRPSNAMSADGPLNLYEGIAVAADPNARGRGVMVVVNDWIHSGQNLIKTSTTDVQTFMSPQRGLIGISSYGNNTFYRGAEKKSGKNGEFNVEGVKSLPRVDIVYADADMAPDLIDASVERGAKGIVIAGVGNGNMSKNALDACKRATQKGVAVVRSSRVPTGVVGRDVEVKDDEVGTIASYELNPQKSRILLALALMKKPSSADLQRMFREY